MTGAASPAGKRILWIDPSFGASGDMMLGTMIGLGAPIESIRRGLAGLDLDGWSLEFQTTRRCSLSAGRALVSTEEQRHHRSWSAIDGILAAAGLPEEVERGSRRTFRRLGEVEAVIHDIEIDQVRFHEVGAVDAIVDIVGSWLALDALHIDEIVAGPVGLGHGSSVAAHGRLPIPAPATTALLMGAEIRAVDVEAETVTPTGAALLTTMANRWGPIPEGTLAMSARGAGARDPVGYPNVLTAYVVESNRSSTTGTDSLHGTVIEQVPAALLTTNLDDVTPEIVGHTIDRCLAAGADDAWSRAITMKKGRPGVELNVLCAMHRLDELRSLVFAETATLGLRTQVVTKHVLPRRFEKVTVRGCTIAMKIGPHGVKPEYDDLVRASHALDVPARKLAVEAMIAFENGVADRL